MAPKGYVELFGTLLHTTELALMADLGFTEVVWIPKSVTEDWPDIDESGEFLIKESFAKDKGWI